ncbi:Signal transduction histidine kinase [Desulfomicrobium norvegicum]|uniref:histidine kinase n=1 Tax=Desulfomicrobium norvegicum (strain DSM 1741 / NCIMB 8310) TaxID=52561 RepID=A0A8G2F5Q6_DESNO|nr:response regulator [Desulfomicrobium norvegicum]SFL62917.1 Signal transduction histidine kinase [Desulfomicrobium norvegicum]
MRLAFFQSLRAMLFGLVLLSVLPALGIILLNGLQSRDNAFRHAEGELVRIVTAMAGVQQRTSEVTRQTLSTLSVMDRVQNRDVDGCMAIFKRILLHNPLYTNLALTDPKGEVLASAVPMSFGSLADRKHFRDAMRTRDFSPGEFIVSRGTSIPSFPFAYPLLDERGQVKGVLTVALDLTRLHSFFVGQHLPDDSFLGIADHEGRRIYRSVVDESFPLGEFVSPVAWAKSKQGGDSGVFVSKGSDGLSRMNAFCKIRHAHGAEPYMTLFVGVPEASIGADAHKAMATGLLLSACAALLALVMAWVAERTFVMPRINALVMAAERFRTGDYTRPTGVDHDAGELGLVAEALDRMALERRIAQEDLHRAKEAAEDASRSKSEFLANMSHEIRTPLNGVLSMLQLLQTTEPDVEQQEYLEAAIRSTNRLSRLLSDILDLSRIESNKLVIQEESFAFADVRQSIIDIFGVPAHEKGVRLEVRADPRIPAHLFGDEVRLRQILFNLVGNAVKFTPKGRIDVRFVLVSAAGESPCRIRCTVQDSGVGIPGERLNDIFEPFIQVDGSCVRTHQGAGLGLAIVRRLVDLMHGQIQIESVQGEGTSVAVTLPFAVGSSDLARTQYEGMEEDLGGRRFLLVEDDGVNRMAMERILAKFGCEVISATNGREAIKILEREHVDLVFMDVQMPVMDGMEATGIIREELGKDVPIVAMTAYAMAGDRERFLQAGMDAYIAKPVDMAHLKETIISILSRR